jgi:hypothetical protein
MPPTKGVECKTDTGLAADIMNCLPRPFKNMDPGRFENLEKYIAHSVRLSIGMLRQSFHPALIMVLGGGSKSIPKTNADDLKLVKLLRERGYLKQADEIDEDLIMVDIPRMPARANELKFNCAFLAHHLMTAFTEVKPTKYNYGKFQEIAALLYSDVTGKEVESDEMYRACALFIKAVEELNQRAAAKEARKARGKLHNAEADIPPDEPPMD